MLTGVPYLCSMCLNADKGPTSKPRTCRAFPGGIHAEFLFGEPHFETTGDDNGVVFELKPGFQKQLTAYGEFHDVEIPEPLR